MSAPDPMVDDALAALAVPPAPPPLAALFDGELANLGAVTTRRPTRQLAILAVGSLAFGAALIALLSVRRDLGQLPVAWIIAAAIAWFAGFAVPLYLVLVPRPGAVLPRASLAVGVAITAAVGFVVLGLLVHPHGADSGFIGWAHFYRGHGCLWLGLATALVPVVIGALLLRRTLPVGSRWIAAGLGAGAGSLGGLVLHFHCRIADAAHVGIIHGGVVGVSALLAALLVPRATELR